MFFRKDRKIRKILATLTSGFRQGSPRYQQMSVLGTGGFGEVQHCFDLQLNRGVARKVLLANAGELDERRVRLMLNEARLISYIDHPGVVPIYDIFTDVEGKLCYTMKVLEGENLEELLLERANQHHSIPLPFCLQVFTKLCETVASAHHKGVLHLDIKPSNVMIGRFGEVMLLDWGSARLYDSPRYTEFLAASGIPWEGNEIIDPIQGALGSVPNMPLEQMTLSRGLLTPAADVFAAGVLFYVMVGGTYPYWGTNTKEYAMALCSSKKPQELRHLRSDLPPQLSDICMKMIEVDADRRYSSFDEVLQDLQEASHAGSRFRVQTFAPGDILLREGEVGDFALQIVEGEVEISVEIEGTKKVVASCKQGEMIGELAIFSHQPRMATVTALTKTVTRVMTRDDIEKELEKLPPWISQMVRGLSDKFIDRHKKMVAEH